MDNIDADSTQTEAGPDVEEAQGDQQPTSSLPPDSSGLGKAARAGAVKLTNVAQGDRYNGVEVPQDAAYTDGKRWYNSSGGILPDAYRYANGSVNKMSSAYIEKWIGNMQDKGVPPMVIGEFLDPYLKMSQEVQRFQRDQSDNTLAQHATAIANQKAQVDFTQNLAGSVAEAAAKNGDVGGMNAMKLLEQVEGPQAMAQLFPGYSTNPQDSQKNYQLLLNMGAKAGTEQEGKQQTLALRPKELALAQAGFTQGAINDVTNNYQSGLSAAAVARQADQTDQLLTSFLPVYQDLTRQGKGGTILVNKLPAILQPLFQGQNSVNAQTLAQTINAKVGALNAALASNEGVRGAMGSDARAAMEQMASGHLSLTKGDVEQNIPIMRNVISSARDVAKNKIKTYNNANNDLIKNANANGGRLNPSDYTINDPTVKRELSLGDLQAYSQKHNVSMGNAANYLKSQGYTVQGF